jgi:peptidoglycan/LPS O-acetylase OafA/YrhL
MFKLSTTSSFLLNLIRVLSAQAVLFGHCFGVFSIHVPLLTNGVPKSIQHLGVLVFFVLSGFLIAYTVKSKLLQSDYKFKTYFMDRFVRIYAGYLPAILFVVLLDYIHNHYLSGYAYEYRYTAKILLGNLLMLQDIPISIHLPRLTVGNFGSASTFWSLAVEWWLYMFYGMIAFYGIRKQKLDLLFALLLLPTLVFLFYHTVINSTSIRLYSFSIIWLLGAAIFFLFDKNLILKKKQALLLTLTFLSLMVIRFYFVRLAYDVTLAILLAGFIFSIISYCQSLSPVVPQRLNKLIAFFADCSFTLYLTHYTILLIINTNTDYSAPIKLSITVIISNVIAILIAVPTEMQHKKIRKYIFNRFNL